MHINTNHCEVFAQVPVLFRDEKLLYSTVK